MKAKILTLIFLSCFAWLEGLKAQSAPEKPNVLWVLTDDQRYDAVRAFNSMLHGREMSELGYVESPNIDRLAAMGTTFINTYCQAQGCAPSRASMHYGRYTFRSGVYEFEYHNNNTENSYPHLPEQMANLGYQTVHVGKLGVRLRTIQDGRAAKPIIYQTDIDSRTLGDAGLAEWGKITKLTEIDGQTLQNPLSNVVFLRTDSAQVYYISEQLETENPQFAGMAQEAYDRFDLMKKHTNVVPETVFNPGILAGVSPRQAGNTRDGFYNTAFLRFLEADNSVFKLGSLYFEGVKSSKPLFCHIGYDFPHTPVLPPAEYRERFQQYTYKVPELSSQEWNSMPAQLQKQVKNSYSNDFTEEQKQMMIQDYFAFCAYGDDLVGEAVDAFIDYSETNDQPWLVVFVCGDHGWKLNEHGAYSKFTPWEIDSHNPIIVVSSDTVTFPAGKVVEEYTEFVDIAPTILGAAGADIVSPDFSYLDGLDLKDVASGQAPVRDYVIGESHAVTGPRAYIRTHDFVFSMQTRPNKIRGENMLWALNASYSDLDPALYHLPTDPQETRNLAFLTEYRDIADQMKEKLTNIVLGDNRAETPWGSGTSSDAIGTTVYRSNFAPGAHDYKLDLYYTHDPESTEELRIRKGLPNFFSKVNKQDTITIGFVGGSITAGEGKWSEKTFDYLKERYPESHFEWINIAVPGTPVTFGSYRMGSEMLTGDPDLVFIEYRVNGLGGQGIRGIEGMIRQVFRSNPRTDICIVYTISEGMIESIRNRQQTSVGEVIESAANHYGIPSIDMGIEVVRLLDLDSLVFSNDVPVEGKIVFSEDGVHPVDAGSDIYRDVVARSLEAMEQYSAATIHSLPPPIDKKNFEFPVIHTIDEVNRSSNWTEVDISSDEIYRSARWRTEYVLDRTIKCDIVGESLSFDWTGFSLCLTTLPQGEGMAVEVSTDGGEAKEYVFSQQGTDRYGSYMFYLPELENGDHTTTLKITKLPDATTFNFGQFYSVELTPVDSVLITPGELTVTVHDTFQLSSAIYPPGLEYLNTEWISLNDDLATVSESGELIAITPGVVNIVFSANNVSDTLRVNIAPILATSLVLDREQVTLQVSDTIRLYAVLLPETTTDPTVTWSSGNMEIATVTEFGLVEAISGGNTFISALNEASGIGDTTLLVITQIDGIDTKQSMIFRIYPNPVTGSTIQVSSTEPGTLFSILNISGQAICTGVIEDNEVEVGDLPEGIYFLQVESNVIKFIKA